LHQTNGKYLPVFVTTTKCWLSDCTFSEALSLSVGNSIRDSMHYNTIKAFQKFVNGNSPKIAQISKN